MLTWPALSARLNALAYSRVANATVSLLVISALEDTAGEPLLDTNGDRLFDTVGSQQSLAVIWDEPFSDELGISTSEPRMTLLARDAYLSNIDRHSENVAVVKDGVLYRTVDAQYDSEGVVICTMRRNA